MRMFPEEIQGASPTLHYMSKPSKPQAWKHQNRGAGNTGVSTASYIINVIWCAIVQGISNLHNLVRMAEHNSLPIVSKCEAPHAFSEALIMPALHGKTKTCTVIPDHGRDRGKGIPVGG